MASNLTDHLRALPDDALAALLSRRPDLLTPAPADLSALAARAQSRVSVARALDGLDLFTLEILDACRLTRAPEEPHATSVWAVLEAVAGTVPEALVRAAVTRLRDLLMVYGTDTALHVQGGVDEVCPPYPAGLGRPAALLDHAAGELADDPAGLRRALLAAPPAGRAVLDRLAAGPPVGTVAPDAIADPASTVGELVTRHLLVAVGEDTVELPREVAAALRRDSLLGPLHPAEPAGSGASRPPKTINSAGTGQVMEVVRHAGDILAALDEEPAPVLRTGGMGVRDLRRLARAAGIAEGDAAVIIEVAAAASLLGEAESGGELRFVPTIGYDRWVGGPVAQRWITLARAWMVMNRQPALVGTRTAAAKAASTGGPAMRVSTDRAVNVLAPEVERTGAARLRGAVLGILADMPPGATPGTDEVLEVLHWRSPRRSPWKPSSQDAAAADPVRWILIEAAQLGLTGLGGLTGYGRLAVEEVFAAAVRDADDDPLGLSRPDAVNGSRAVAAVDKLLPPPVDHFLVQADLTVVVPGPPEPELAAELDVVADHESAGAASVYRITPDSVRRALDSGYSAGDLQGLFARRSRTPVPQALTYLIDDVARRHGGLRLGSAGCYLRSEDTALVTELAADRRLAALGLRVVAPTVLVSPYQVNRVLNELRAAGHAPVAEDGTGLTLARRRVLRAAPRRSTLAVPAFADGAHNLTPPRLAGAVEALRRGDAAARSARRAPVTVRAASADAATATQAHTQAMAVLQQAIRDRAQVWVGYVDSHGATASRLLRPVSIGAGYLRAEDERTETLHTFALHRITAAVVDG